MDDHARRDATMAVAIVLLIAAAVLLMAFAR
jgi:hypothetical protein